MMPGADKPTAQEVTAGGDILRPWLAAVVGELTAATLVTAPDEASLGARADERRGLVECARQSRLESIFRQAAGLVRPEKPEGQVETGWINHFIECAQDVEAERAQTVWASLLATEVVAPGSVVRRTLSFLRDMDLWELDAFIEYCAFAFSFESGWRFMFDEELARREMWSYGREIDLTQHWITIGLLATETARIEAGSVRGLRIRYRDRIWEIRRDETHAADIEQPGFAYRKFTVTGQQIAAALKTKPFNGYARNLVNGLNAANGASMVAIEPEAG